MVLMEERKRKEGKESKSESVGLSAKFSSAKFRSEFFAQNFR